MARSGKTAQSRKPRPSLVTISVEDLRTILSEAQAPSVVVKEAPEPPARFILTRTTVKDLGDPSATPCLPPNVSLLRVFAQQVPTGSANAFSVLAGSPDTVLDSDRPPDVTLVPRADQTGSGAHGKRGGVHNEHHARSVSLPLADRHVKQPAPVTSDAALGVPPQKSAPAATTAKTTKSREKEPAFQNLKARAGSAASFDELPVAFKDLVPLIHDYKSSSPTMACLAALDSVQEHLKNHHEILCPSENSESYSALLTKAVMTPLQTIEAQLLQQHKAPQSLTKSVEKIKPSPSLMTASAAAPVSSTVFPKPKPAPLLHPSDEHLLVRCDGDPPEIFQLPYHQVILLVNNVLVRHSLPKILYTARLNTLSIFLVPESKDATTKLGAAWDVLRRRRSTVTYKLMFQECNPPHGSVSGTPTWVNKLPSQAQIAAAIAAGRKPRTVRSVFIRLESCHMVNLAVAGRRVILAGGAPMVVHGFLHLRVTQCWGCLQFGHTKARCSVKEYVMNVPLMHYTQWQVEMVMHYSHCLTVGDMGINALLW
ncbi:hypothetical protein B0H17DRAFT_1128311 [Mycena rosella]|uniref:Uncharacterized protein n=1 Tax=Mycena rosella TaxID=1033263 RepID=A0AAD7DZM8_MYCRO|nr:hypothetical protein B0H17DRAFT_1128311 [Mycena rosella]